MTCCRIRKLLTLIALGGLVCAGRPVRGQGLDDTSTFTLAVQEKEIARQVAEEEINRKALRTASPLYLVDMELIVAKGEEKGEAAGKRLARVVHYRYEGDLAIVSLVDLASRSTVQQETVAHLSVPLSEEEFNVARELVLADPRMKQQLGAQSQSVTPEALVLRAASPRDPIYGHRVLRFMFRLPDGTYLSKLIALVDLTDRKVTLEKFPAGSRGR